VRLAVLGSRGPATKEPGIGEKDQMYELPETQRIVAQAASADVQLPSDRILWAIEKCYHAARWVVDSEDRTRCQDAVHEVVDAIAAEIASFVRDGDEEPDAIAFDIIFAGHARWEAHKERIGKLVEDLQILD
jgi:hypothetical protein